MTSSRVLMALFVGTAVVLILALPEASATTTNECFLQRFGSLAMFNGERGSIEMPCKFRLADFQCHDFRVLVTPGQVVDGYRGNRFSVETVRVKIFRVSTGQMFVFRTSAYLLRKAAKENGEPWIQKAAVDPHPLDFVGYDAARGAAVLTVNDTFEVLFSSPRLRHRWGEDEADVGGAGVEVRCFNGNFTSTGLDESLCGDGVTENAVQVRKKELYGCGNGVQRAQFFHHVILNNKAVIQNDKCEGLAQQFQNCPFQENAVRTCEAIMGKVTLARCLAPDPTTTFQDLYGDCLKYACMGDIPANSRLRYYVKNNCPDLFFSVPSAVC